MLRVHTPNLPAYRTRPGTGPRRVPGSSYAHRTKPQDTGPHRVLGSRGSEHVRLGSLHRAPGASGTAPGVHKRQGHDGEAQPVRRRPSTHGWPRHDLPAPSTGSRTIPRVSRAKTYDFSKGRDRRCPLPLSCSLLHIADGNFFHAIANRAPSSPVKRQVRRPESSNGRAPRGRAAPDRHAQGLDDPRAPAATVPAYRQAGDLGWSVSDGGTPMSGRARPVAR